MPHECTECGRAFPDGSKEMLSGCPDCGGNKFQFRPEGADPPSTGSASGSATGSGGSASGSATGSGGSASPSAADSGDAEPPSGDGASTRGQSTDSTGNGGVRRPGDANVGKPNGPPASGPESATTDDDDDIIEADERPVSSTGPEDTAQADARSGFASPDEVAGAAPDGSEEGTVSTGDDGVPEQGHTETAGTSTTDPRAEARAKRDGTEASPSSDSPTGPPAEDGKAPASTDVDSGDEQASDEAQPNLDDLRAELNDQFESIRIVDPGKYELNLMELYDREEHIISLREDGRYVIEVPETWRDG